MVKKLIYCSLVLFIGIFLIYLVFTWQIQRATKSLPPAFQELRKLPTGEVKNKLFEETTEYKKFVSPDGKFQMRYLADWIKVDKPNYSPLAPEKISLIENAETIFFAQKIKIKKGAMGILVIQEVKPKEESEEIFKKIKKEIEKKEGKIIKEDLQKLDLDVEYKSEVVGMENFAKLKLFEGKEKNYLFAFFTFKRNWEDFQKEIEEIIQSVKIEK